MADVMSLRRTERRLLDKLMKVEGRRKAHSVSAETTANQHDSLITKLADIQRRIAATLPPVEHEDGWLVLYRDECDDLTDVCAFCGDRHAHGYGDGRGEGFRAAHCGGQARVVAADGTVVKRGGYVVKNRPTTLTAHELRRLILGRVVRGTAFPASDFAKLLRLAGAEWVGALQTARAREGESAQ
jgi:hypothetical protein